MDPDRLTDDDAARRVRPRISDEASQETLVGTHLGLQFGGGPSTESCLGLWRDSRFSDWPVQLGDKTYSLHAVLLARASSFFLGHASMRVSADAEGTDGKMTMSRGSNLTDVLPSACHAAFETALDFIYSEHKDSFQVPTSEAVLLLKIAEVLGMPGLFDAASRKIEAAFREAAPLFLQQHLSFHIPGTDEGLAMRTLVEKAKGMVVERFEPFLESQGTREAILRMSCAELAEVLEAHDLCVSNEDVVCNFVLGRVHCSAGGVMEDSQGMACDVSHEDALLLWKMVRWAHVSSEVMSQVLEKGGLQVPEVYKSALFALITQRNLRGKTLFVPRRQILPPGIAPPGSLDVDMAFLYREGKFERGELLRSQPKRMGDFVVCLLLYPAGTLRAEGDGCLSAFLEAVPQPGWPESWAFPDIRCSISCLGWTGASEVKQGMGTCSASSMDWGWHGFLPLQDLHRFTSPDGFLCIRGSAHRTSLVRLFLP